MSLHFAGMQPWPIHKPHRDPWDTDYVFRRSEQLVIDVPAWFRHRNVHGEEGARVVQVVRLTPYGDDFEIATYEEPGRVFHTFLASRVLEFIDLDAGERIGDVVAHLTEVHRRSARGQVFLVMRQLDAELLVLKSVAKASGAMREKQRMPILAFARRAAPEFQIDDERFISDLASVVGLEGPTVASALKLIAEKGAKHAADVLAVAEIIAATRTGARDATDKLMIAVRKALSPNASRISVRRK